MNTPTPRGVSNVSKILTEDQIRQSVSYLNRAFKDALDELKGRVGYSNVRGTPVHVFQTEFAYVIDNMQRGPRFLATQYIADANELINTVAAFKRP